MPEIGLIRLKSNASAFVAGRKPTCAVPASRPEARQIPAIGPTVRAIVESVEPIRLFRPAALVARAGSEISASIWRKTARQGLTMEAEQAQAEQAAGEHQPAADVGRAGHLPAFAGRSRCLGGPTRCDPGGHGSRRQRAPRASPTVIELMESSRSGTACWPRRPAVPRRPLAESRQQHVQLGHHAPRPPRAERSSAARSASRGLHGRGRRWRTPARRPPEGGVGRRGQVASAA